LNVLHKLRPTFERMLARDHPLGIRQREFRICDFGLSEFCEPWVKPLDPRSSLRGSARFKQVFRLFSELLQARPSRQLLCIHTNVLPFLCLESAPNQAERMFVLSFLSHEAALGPALFH